MKLTASRRVRRAAAVGAVAVVVAGGISVYAASGASANYRTATAALGNVTQTLAVTGTVSPSGRSDLQFGTSGTVAKVLAVGDRVSKGQVLAQLDTTQLSRALVIAQAAVTSALAQLAADQNTLDTASADTSTPSSDAPAPGGRTGGAAAADAAIAAAQRACVGSGPGATRGPSSAPSPSSAPDPSGSPTPSATATPTPTPTPTPTKAPVGSGGSTTACAAALAKVQQAVSQALMASSRSAGGTTTRTGSAAGSSTAARGGAGGSVTEATISRDEATLAQARTKVIQATQALNGAVITAPVDGTVAAASVKVGATASAGTTAITMIGAGLTTVSVKATLAQVAALAVGQKASVLTTLGKPAASGRITWIGAVPTSSTSSSTFPVVITLTERAMDLAAGSPVDVDITLGTATGVITVPTSAVRNGSVSVLSGGKLSTVRVTVGLVGPQLTQVTQGLTPGQTVALADLNAAIPTSTVNNRFGAGFGGTLRGGLGGGTRRSLGG